MPDLELQRPKQDYTDEDIERGLQAIAFYGTPHKASRQMPDPIPVSTLDYWKTSHAARYTEIRTQTLHHHRQTQAARLEDLATEALETAHQAVQRTRQELKAGTLKNPHDAAHKLTAAAAQATDKALLLRGQPTQITITANATELLDKLERMLPTTKTDIDSTAQEL